MFILLFALVSITSIFFFNPNSTNSLKVTCLSSSKSILLPHKSFSNPLSCISESFITRYFISFEETHGIVPPVQFFESYIVYVPPRLLLILIMKTDNI